MAQKNTIRIKDADGKNGQQNIYYRKSWTQVRKI